MDDYVYDKQYILTNKVGGFKKSIQLSEQYITGLRPHFATPDKPSKMHVQFTLTEHDYDNLQYIAKHRDVFNMLIKKYSALGIQYPVLSHEDIHDIPSAFSLDLKVDLSVKRFFVDEKKLSSQSQFVILYFKTLELVQICIDVYNEFERSGTQLPLIPLKNSVAFVGTARNLTNLPSTIDPYMWNILI